MKSIMLLNLFAKTVKNYLLSPDKSFVKIHWLLYTLYQPEFILCMLGRFTMKCIKLFLCRITSSLNFSIVLLEEAAMHECWNSIPQFMWCSLCYLTGLVMLGRAQGFCSLCSHWNFDGIYERKNVVLMYCQNTMMHQTCEGKGFHLCLIPTILSTKSLINY